MGRKNKAFWESAMLNNSTYIQYYNRLVELSMAMFEWKNLPDTVDERFLELTLFAEGEAVFFFDEVMGYLTLQNIINGPLNVYRIPINRRAFAVNGYQKSLNENDSVIIYNNLLHTNSMRDVQMFARRLYNIDRVIDVNINAQKTPILIKCSENERLTMENLYKNYDGNMPVIFGSKELNTAGISCLTTNAPFVAKDLFEIKTQLWNEALTYLGISNINVVKKERLITDEVTRNQGGTIASRYSRLESRRRACKQINELFGLNIWCDYREDYQAISPDEDVVTGEPNSEGEGDENIT